MSSTPSAWIRWPSSPTRWVHCGRWPLRSPSLRGCHGSFSWAHRQGSSGRTSRSSCVCSVCPLLAQFIGRRAHVEPDPRGQPPVLGRRPRHAPTSASDDAIARMPTWRARRRNLDSHLSMRAKRSADAGGLRRRARSWATTWKRLGVPHRSRLGRRRTRFLSPHPRPSQLVDGESPLIRLHRIPDAGHLVWVRPASNRLVAEIERSRGTVPAW